MSVDNPINIDRTAKRSEVTTANGHFYDVIYNGDALIARSEAELNRLSRGLSAYAQQIGAPGEPEVGAGVGIGGTTQEYRLRWKWTPEQRSEFLRKGVEDDGQAE